MILVVTFSSQTSLARNPHAIASIKPRDAASRNQLEKGVNRKEIILM